MFLVIFMQRFLVPIDSRVLLNPSNSPLATGL